MKPTRLIPLFFLFALTVVACTPAPGGPPTPTAAPPEPEDVSVPYPAPTQITQPTPAGDGYPAPATPSSGDAYPPPATSPPERAPASPIPVAFPSLDGVLLAGTYYPPLAAPSPVVLLMHQFGSDQRQWDEIALWLQTGQPSPGASWLPPLPEGLTFAVFTFDFRGHGASEGNRNLDAGLLMDAQAALAFAKTQSGAAPDRVLTIGTSVGADAAVDACVSLTDEASVAETQETQGCVGALSLSPGSYLGVDYASAANALLADPHRLTIYCLAAEGDGVSPGTCQSVSHENFRAVIYAGNAHGVALLRPGLEPDVGALILEFLLASLPTQP